MTSPPRVPAAPDRRTLVVAGVGLLLAAVGFWASAQPDWYRVTAEVPLRGPVQIGVTGGQVLPALTGLALLALAGIAALVALGGPARRVLGGSLAVAGALVAGSAALSAVASPYATDAVEPEFPAPPPGVPVDVLRYAPTEITAAPWLAVVAGLLLAVVGVLVLVREHRLPRLGARYAAPGPRRQAVDPDRAAWDALDAGRDPTDPTAPPRRRAGPPGVGDGSAGGGPGPSEPPSEAGPRS